MNRSALTLALAAAAIALALAFWSLRPADEPGQGPAAGPAAAAPAAAIRERPIRATVAAREMELSPQDREFVDGLRQKFARAISDRHARIKLIEQVIAYLREHYPEDWQSRVRAVLSELFPELVEQLYADFERLLGFNEWLRSHRETLMGLSPEARRAALWDARRAAFGDAAVEIWRGEVRNQQLIEALAVIDQAQGKGPEQKLAQFLEAVNAAYGPDAPQFIDSTQTELLSRFLSVESVQADLRVMPRPQQHATLRRLRAAVGMDDEALQRWDALDAARDQAWDAGRSYELQRAALAARYEGPELASQLTRLQDQVFGAEAETIRTEEAAGFFRFGSERRIGRE